MIAALPKNDTTCEVGDRRMLVCSQLQHIIVRMYYLHYLTGSNIPYQTDRKFTEQQTAVDSESSSESTTLTYRMSKLLNHTATIITTLYPFTFFLIKVYSWFLPRNFYLKFCSLPTTHPHMDKNLERKHSTQASNRLHIEFTLFD